MKKLNYERLSKESGHSIQELQQLVYEKAEELMGLVSVEGAFIIISNELGVKMDEEKIIGIVSKYNKSQYGAGIQINGNWYNPKGKVEAYVKKELEGQEVEITMIDKKTFSFLKILNSNPSGSKSDSKPSNQSNNEPKDGTKDNYWKQKEERDIANQPKITMMACIKSACDLFSLDLNKLDLDSVESKIGIVKSVAKEFYEMIEETEKEYPAEENSGVA